MNFRNCALPFCPGEFLSLLSAIVFCLFAVGASGVEAQEFDKSLIGVWEAEQEFNDSRVRTLALRNLDGQWTAGIGEERFPVGSQSGSMSFEMPDRSGKVRAKISADEESISGFWIQPVTQNLNFPLATPLRFEKTDDQWLAEFEPYRDRMRMYLVISKPDDRPMEAFIRNPERNVGIRLGYLLVETERDTFNLRQMRGDNLFAGKRLGSGTDDSLEILLPYSNKPFVFRRTQRSEVSGFYAATTTQPYRYRQPPNNDDGWATASAEEVGFETGLLQELVQELRDAETTELTTPYIHSILISRRGILVFEEYFCGFDRNQPHDTRSAGKSVASMLVGSALDKNDSLNESKTLMSIFGNSFREPSAGSGDATPEQRNIWRQQITIEHALAMQSGLDADDSNYDSPGSEDRMQDQTAQPDWIRFAMAAPMIRQPGTQSVYGSNNINLAAAAVSSATQRWLPDLFEAHLAAPLGITNYHFNLDPAENGYMGGGIRLTPRDQLKLGQVMLDDGKWNGQQVISERWVRESIRARGSIHEPDDYALGWWRKTLELGSRQVDVFHASGNGGQLIVVIPEFELVVQMSAGNYGNFPVWYRNLTDLIPQKILSAIK